MPPFDPQILLQIRQLIARDLQAIAGKDTTETPKSCEPLQRAAVATDWYRKGRPN